MMELQEAFDRGFEAVKAYVDTNIAAFEKRLATLEARAPERGERGEKGEHGEIGPQGEKGETGAQGEKGDAGEQGPQGEPGAIGAKGEQGDRGLDGRDGQPGRDGLPGSQGEKGIDGKDGRDGIDGKDGLGFDDIAVEFDGERGFTFAFVRGEQRKEFGAFIVPVQIYRGVWKEGAYAKGDSVTWGGSQWIAKQDTTTKPDTKDSDWQLTVKRGRDGKDGKDGERGPEGKQGPQGREGGWR